MGIDGNRNLGIEGLVEDNTRNTKIDQVNARVKQHGEVAGPVLCFWVISAKAKCVRSSDGYVDQACFRRLLYYERTRTGLLTFARGRAAAPYRKQKKTKRGS